VDARGDAQLEILDPAGLELDETQARDTLVSGQGVFTSNVGNVFPRSNNPQHQQARRRHPHDALPGPQGRQRGRWAGRGCTA
jgi:hypothetical protein